MKTKTWIIGLSALPSPIFLIAGLLLKSYNLVLIAVLFLWLNNLLFCFSNFKKNALFFLYNCTFFVFLIGRPTIDFLNGVSWWTSMQGPGLNFAMAALYIGLLGLRIGAYCADGLMSKNKKMDTVAYWQRSGDDQVFLRSVRYLSLFVFFVALAALLVTETEKLLFVRAHDYVSYFAQFKSTLPAMVPRLASFAKFSLCIYLATMPKKYSAYVPLGLYVLSAVPALLMGLRNPIVLNALFALCYFIIRDFYMDRQKWIGRVEGVGLLAAVPVGVTVMAKYAYIRNGAVDVMPGFIPMISGFFYSQGITFQVLKMGYDSIPFLPQRAFRNYTFGGMIDYVCHNTLTQKLFGTKAFTSSNDLVNALESNSFAHNFSYVADKENYLAGGGWGSSYLLETFADFGYIGMFLFSVLLGFFLIYALVLLKKNVYLTSGILVVLTGIFFSPRAGATECIEFLVQIRYWACFAGCFVGGAVLKKIYLSKRRPFAKNIQK